MTGEHNPVAKAVCRLRPLAIRSKKRDFPSTRKDKGHSDAALRICA